MVAVMGLFASGLTLAGDRDLPVNITADVMRYDQKTGVAAAEGKVEAIQGKDTLYSDEVMYDQHTNTIRASGNILLKDAQGNRYYADDAELSNNMDDGIIHNLEARFTDNSLLQAQEATRVGGVRMYMQRALYTPCRICKHSKLINPTWQIRANTVKLDKNKEYMSYKHAFFDVYGVPVLYTPYMSHPSPGAKRKGGFLVPSYGNDTLLGYTLKLPYYFNIAPNMDATFSPIYTSKEGMVWSGEARHLISSGAYELKGSITNPDRLDETGQPIGGKKIRGHIEGKGAFTLNDDWSWGFSGKRVSDDTYLRRYHFGEEDTLTSRTYAEKIRDRNYVIIQTLSFQGLNVEDDPARTPFIFPYAQTHYESGPGYKGSRWIMDTDTLMLMRSEGMQSRHTSVKTGWKLPYTTRSGQVLLFQASTRGDLYSMDQNGDDVNQPPLDSNFENRLLPEVELDWSFPLVKEEENHRIIIEPIANFIASPYGGNPAAIPNEDSQVIDLSDINLFSANRFTGIDRIETGPRMNYGIRGGVHGDNGQHADFLFGQSYHTENNSNLLESSGLDDHASDYVGRIGFMTSEVLNLGYRFRLDKEDLSPRRNEYIAGINVKPVRLDVDYVSLDAGSSTLSTIDREELFGQVSWDINSRWEVSSHARRNLAAGNFVSSGAAVLYKGDCVTLATTWFREFTRDRDIEPSSSITFQILLKNLS